MTDLQTTIDKLRTACADPDGPLYGSDLVPLICKEPFNYCCELLHEELGHFFNACPEWSPKENEETDGE